MISKARRNWMHELANRETEVDSSGLRRGSIGREDHLAQAVRELLDENGELRIAMRGLVLDMGPRLDAYRELLDGPTGHLQDTRSVPTPLPVVSDRSQSSSESDPNT